MKTSAAPKISLLGCLLLATAPVLHAGDEWLPAGPYGGACNEVVIDPVDPSRAYAACRFGFYRSLDGGSSWSPVIQGLDSTWAEAVAVDPTLPSTLYQSSLTALFKSTDSGASWTQVLGGADRVCQLLVDPSSPATVYAGECLGGSIRPELWKSIDGGATWSLVGAGVGTGGAFNALCFDPANSSSLFATTHDLGALRSSDGGATFAAIGGGTLPATALGLAVDPANSSRIFVGSYDGIYRSTDGGASFALITGVDIIGQQLRFDSLGDLYSTSGTGAPSLHRSTDGGATWSPVSGYPDAQAFLLAGATSDPSRLLVGNSRGLLRSVDGGMTWASANQGLEGAECRRFAADPSAAATLYCAMGVYGIAKSIDGGESWSYVNAGLGVDGVTQTNSVVVDPAAPNRLYASQSNHAIYTSVDGGATWSLQLSPLPDLMELAYVHPTDGSLWAVGGFNPVWRSDDGGMTWGMSSTGIGPFIASSLTLAPSDPMTAWVTLDFGGGLFESTDGGSSWSRLMISRTNGNELLVDPSDAQVLYMPTTEDGISKSIDGGVTWNPSASGIAGTVWSLALSPRDSDTLYAGTDNQGAFRSTDGGATWRPLPAGPTPPIPFANLGLLDLVLPASNPERLVAGTQRGVHQLDQTIFADGFESGDTTAWVPPTP